MNYLAGVVWGVCAIGICLSGCGGNSPSSSSSENNRCAGVALSGMLRDSLTNQPVSQGWAVLESGTQLSTTQVYNFSQTQRAASDSTGAFSICSPAVANPSVMVLVALDSSGRAYPPFVAPVFGTINLGTIPMGGCTLTCGFEGQQQTSSPATISGVITSLPISKTGEVTPQYSLGALDGTSNLWNLVMPALKDSQTSTFDTAPSGCAERVPFCATYAFTVPSQRPVRSVQGGYEQGAGAPVYSVYGVPDGTSSCSPTASRVVYQQDGTSLLTGAPGAQLQAADINFTGCQ